MILGLIRSKNKEPDILNAKCKGKFGHKNIS